MFDILQRHGGVKFNPEALLKPPTLVGTPKTPLNDLRFRPVSSLKQRIRLKTTTEEATTAAANEQATEATTAYDEGTITIPHHNICLINFCFDDIFQGGRKCGLSDLRNFNCCSATFILPQVETEGF